MAESPKLTLRSPRSRGFTCFKFTLVAALGLLVVLTLVSIPWCIDLTRDLYRELNATGLYNIYGDGSGIAEGADGSGTSGGGGMTTFIISDPLV